jgi:hypothetical protein
MAEKGQKKLPWPRRAKKNKLALLGHMVAEECQKIFTMAEKGQNK